MSKGFGSFTLIDNTPMEQRRAAVLACAHAGDEDDARELLRALGLIPDPEAKPIHHVVQLGPVKTRSRAKRKAQPVGENA